MLTNAHSNPRGVRDPTPKGNSELAAIALSWFVDASLVSAPIAVANAAGTSIGTYDKERSIMSRRTIAALAASIIFGIGFIMTISTDASAYYRGGVARGGVYRGGVYRGGVYRGGYYRGVRPGVAVGVGAAAVGAAAVGAAAAGAYYAPGYYAPRPVACGYYPYPPCY